MKSRLTFLFFRRFVGVTLLLLLVTGQATSVLAQGYGAVQAVRQRVSGGLPGAGGEAAPGERPGTEPGRGPAPGVAEQPGVAANAPKLDLTFVSSNAVLVAVVRPAQILAAPVVQLLPTEVAAAASREWLGVEPSEIEEVAAFLELGNPTQPMFGLTYGLTFKFKSPFRATSIPEKLRPAVQLAELNSKKYLKSAHPLLPSFYGPNNKTLVAAPDAMLRKIVEASTQPKNGALMEKAEQATGGNDLYLAIDGERARGIVPLVMGMGGIKMPDQAKAFVEAVKAAEVTLNLVSRGPINVVVHCNDEAAAQQINQFIAEQRQKMAAAQSPEAASTEQPAAFDPNAPQADGGKYAQEMTQFRERMNQRFQPQVSGASITFLRIEADDPLQQQLFGMIVGAAATAASMKSQAAVKGGAAAPSTPPTPGGTSGAEGQPAASPPPDGSTPPPDNSAPTPGRRR